MQNVFVQTENVNRFNDICAELEGPDSLIGPSLAMITGPAGRGKSEAARYYATQTRACYLPPLNKRTPLMLLREITFDLCTIKPWRIEGCIELIGSEMGRDRRLVIIDEADLIPISLLELLRNVNERYGCPILLIGEEELRGKIASRRRLSSRIRRAMNFGPVTQPDVVLFFRKAVRMEIAPAAAGLIHRASRGDWRPILTIATDIERAALASGLREIPEELVKEIIDAREKRA